MVGMRVTHMVCCVGVQAPSSLVGDPGYVRNILHRITLELITFMLWI